MAKIKYDGVIEAVHFEPDGRIKWVRAYLRRGPEFSDRVMIDRQTLIDYLKSGKKFYSGKRVERMGGTFEIFEPVQLIQSGTADYLVVGQSDPGRDCFTNVPVI